MCDMKTFDTEPLMQELNSVMNAGLSKMLSKYVDRYNLLENTHKQIMNLPSVRFEMNNRENESESDKQHFSCINDIRAQIIKTHIDTIKNLRNEICELKDSLSKRPICNCKTCDNTCEKINIKLEIEDIPMDDVKSITNNVDAAAIVDDNTDAEDDDDDDDDEEDEEEDEEDDEDDEDEEDEEEDDDKIAADKVIADKVIADKIVAVVKDDDIETENESEEEDEDDFFEIEIDDVTYCTNNEETGIIYEVDKDGDMGKRIGYLKDGEPFFDNE